MIVLRSGLYSSGPENEKRVSLSDINSNRGFGRAVLLSSETGGMGAVGGYFGKRRAEKLDAQGKSDEEIIKGAASHGGKVGAMTGAMTGAMIGGAKFGGPSLPGKALAMGAGALIGGIGSGLGGYFGAKKNTQDKIDQRNRMMNNQGY